MPLIPFDTHRALAEEYYRRGRDARDERELAGKAPVGTIEGDGGAVFEKAVLLKSGLSAILSDVAGGDGNVSLGQSLVDDEVCLLQLSGGLGLAPQLNPTLHPQVHHLQILMLKLGDAVLRTLHRTRKVGFI